MTINPSVAVVIPTTGSSHLLDAVNSVFLQTYPNVYPHIFLDGPETKHKLSIWTKAKITHLGEKVGKVDGHCYYGHRVYAASPHLVNADFICLLDEDNWFHSDHVASLVDMCLSENLHFAFSLRKIYDKDGKFVCDDKCESLGFWPIWGGKLDGLNQFHVDTNSYCFRRSTFAQYSWLWHGGYGQDRIFFHNVRNTNIPYGTTAQHTMCYRLDGNPKSVNADFFLRGNDISGPQQFERKTNAA
jgi:hypothetical protein